jgi:hypothetical protein
MYIIVLNWISKHIIEIDVENNNTSKIDQLLDDKNVPFARIGSSQYHDLLMIKANGVPVFQFAYNPNAKLRTYPKFKFIPLKSAL